MAESLRRRISRAILFAIADMLPPEDVAAAIGPRQSDDGGRHGVSSDPRGRGTGRSKRPTGGATGRREPPDAIEIERRQRALRAQVEVLERSIQ